MPSFPKYSERINLFFVIFGKEIPLLREPGLLDRILSHFSGSTRVNRVLRRAISLTERVNRIHNMACRPETSVQHIEIIRNAINNFFSEARPIIVSSEMESWRKTRALWTLIRAAVEAINRALASMDSTFLLNYGTIAATELHFTVPTEFIELVRIAHKVMSKDLRPIAASIMDNYEPLIHAVQTLSRRTALAVVQ